MKNKLLSEQIRDVAVSSGIDALGFAPASEFTNYALPGSRRRDPNLSLPNAKSIIVGGVYIGGIILPAWINPWYGRSSRLYLSHFFLDVVKPFAPIVDLLQSSGHKAIVCDSSSEQGSVLPLKLAAIRAGLGWQGKQSLLLTKKFGTFLALGGILTNAALEYNSKVDSNRCRNCDECQKACPLAAIDTPHLLNRNRCLSNLLQCNSLPEKAQPVMGNQIVDCEICQDVCPWNIRHMQHPLKTEFIASFQKKINEWEKIFYLPNLVKLSESGYRDALGHLNTGIPYKLFHRNVSFALERAKKIK